MAANGNGAPIIIKKKKKVMGGGHHGGAWKVAIWIGPFGMSLLRRYVHRLRGTPRSF
ncbi:hypothetical protein ROJ8625_00773 [Roseivivax jejudonensis]|uniref:Uncharacterized protein n=1 Tax=Roseivivax jejudonensis TaxID=1529041 RepID=A0A1X6YGM5_9RHOB|nr:hypothetical protein ROJ8625_00773 [Roseivivax jejudonensis]